MHVKQTVATGLATLALLVAGTSTAGAEVLVVSKTGGSVSCAAGSVVGVIAKGNGFLSFYVPKSGAAEYGVDVGGVIQSVTYNTGRQSIRSWRVTSTGVLDDEGTGATCLPRPAPDSNAHS